MVRPTVLTEDTLIVHVDLALYIDIKDLAVLIAYYPFIQSQLTDLNMYIIIMGTEGLA